MLGLTLKGPTTPKARRMVVEPRTETKNATDPSTVFPPVWDQRTRPNRLPTIEACDRSQ